MLIELAFELVMEQIRNRAVKSAEEARRLLYDTFETLRGLAEQPEDAADA